MQRRAGRSFGVETRTLCQQCFRSAHQPDGVALLPGENAAKMQVLMFVNGMTVNTAYASHGMLLQLSGTPAFRVLMKELQRPANCHISDMSTVVRQSLFVYRVDCCSL